MSEKVFTLHVPDSELRLLQEKLRITRFQDELEGADWDYGVPLTDIKRLAARWGDSFDWRRAESEINKIPQFTRDIEVDGFGSLNIHYVHCRSKLDDALPLLFVHGWPGHFMEVAKILPLLNAISPDQPSFHVVALSLPGFGFSEAPKKKGFSILQFAEVGHKLMLALGYNEYVTQGGDWGTMTTRAICDKYGGDHAKAWHVNCPGPLGPPSFRSAPWQYIKFLLTPLTDAEHEGLERTKYFNDKGTGYVAVQSTKPQTLGYSLSDSPVGLLAWIYEKLVAWTDDYPWTDDEVLQWVSIYWFSRPGPAASIRIYYEAFSSGQIFASPYIKVPSGISIFPKEILRYPRLWCNSLGNLVYVSEHLKGGHFAAHEVPELLVDDIRKMFGIGGPAFGVVAGKSGYAIS